MSLGENTANPHPVFQHLLGRQTGQPAHLSRMRGEDERPLGRGKGFDLSCKGCDPIGIEDDRKIQHLDQLEDEGLCFLEGSNSRSDNDGLLVFAEAKDRIESPEAKGLLGLFPEAVRS